MPTAEIFAANSLASARAASAFFRNGLFDDPNVGIERGSAIR
jgi:hypothetical protein